ncbi:HIG1 domain family member 1C [Parasteatoda tepidariorum]|uniref:HIG1 domain family member 1C n=1 Tax=Parasteatoda tepidariorum TaxID=114398 RepID=UPI00077FCF7F|nr:HIG1 domain family member 1C [Parasteatoda tepidariorum]XP_015917880.1 HIG1 domain family member 1C [Parasteatoda tepidariorum]
MADRSKTSLERPDIDFAEESTLQKLSRKTRDSPMMVAGLSGFFVIAAYGIYSFRNRGKLSASNYLMQLRVTAQGAVIGCLTIGVMKSIYDHLTKKKDDS